MALDRPRRDAEAHPDPGPVDAQLDATLGLSGTQTATWAGQTADATSVLVRYTLAGDTNLDGVSGRRPFQRLLARGVTRPSALSPARLRMALISIEVSMLPSGS